MATMIQKLMHVKSGCPACQIVFVPHSGMTSGGFNNVQLSDACRKVLEEQCSHYASTVREEEDVICSDCGEHASIVSCDQCGESFGTNCCDAPGRSYE